MKHLFEKIFLNKNSYFAPEKKQEKMRGFMIVEVLVAVSIIVVSILAAMAVAQKSVHVSRQAFHATQAGFLLEEGSEAVRIVRDRAWNDISSLIAGADYYPTFSGNTWTLSATPNTVGIFTRAVSVADVNRNDATKDISSAGVNDARTKLVTITVSWSEGGASVAKTLKFYLMDIFSP